MRNFQTDWIGIALLKEGFYFFTCVHRWKINRKKLLNHYSLFKEKFQRWCWWKSIPKTSLGKISLFPPLPFRYIYMYLDFLFSFTYRLALPSTVGTLTRNHENISQTRHLVWKKMLEPSWSKFLTFKNLEVYGTKHFREDLKKIRFSLTAFLIDSDLSQSSPLPWKCPCIQIWRISIKYYQTWLSGSDL